jgi:helix-turn-helix protein
MSGMTEKWGKRVAERGFAQVPNYLLLMNQFLEEEHRLSPVEMLILLQLVGAWWKKDESPYPSLRTLAARAGISDRQAQRAVTALEEKGYMKREKRKRGRLVASNSYNLGLLVERLNEIALAFPNDSPRRIPRKAPAPTKPMKIRRPPAALRKAT